jgi:hypothetical protein
MLIVINYLHIIVINIIFLNKRFCMELQNNVLNFILKRANAYVSEYC